MQARAYSSIAADPGLSPQEVLISRNQHGENRVTPQKRRGFFRQFLESFSDPVIKILLIVLAINVLFMFRRFDWYETAGIALAIFLATFISTLSEYGSETAFLRLQQDAERAVCRVRRAGRPEQIPVSEVVAGDLVLLEAGERVPADGVLLSGRLSVDQSPLNGESREAEKRPGGGRTPQKWDLAGADQLFQGCTVAAGEGVMRVCRVGDGTFYGGMAQQMQEETRESPLKLRLGGLARTISRLGYMAAGLVFLADLFNSLFMDYNFNMAAIGEAVSNLPLMLEYFIHALTLGITVVVVAVPEGLPMMITVVLSSNMKRMLKDHVLVRKLVGIETSGSLNILFTDKTGTLTQGHLKVGDFLDGQGHCFDTAAALRRSPGLYHLVELSCLYNTASSLSGGRAIGGNATDRALLDYIAAAPSAGAAAYRVRSSLPFDSANKFSAVQLAGPRTLYLVKGAPEKLLPACTHYYDHQGAAQPAGGLDQLRERLCEHTRSMERVVALAVSPQPPSASGRFAGLTLIGLACIRDAIRPDAARAIAQIRQAGIQVVMVTGDSLDTASAIARRTGLLEAGGEAVTSAQLAAMDDEALARRLPRLRVVARALPADKSRLVRVAQQQGLVAGMTGDGINDAPALKRADVGFSMGSGTEVAKEAGDIVILNNHIASIARAVLYGRTIFKSIRKFIVFQLTMNLCAVGVSIIGPFIGVDTPVTVIQMLWINMIMDTLGGLAFAGEPPLEDSMREMPKRRDEPILNSYMIHQIVITGLISVGLCTLFLKLPLTRALFRYETDPLYFLTAFFVLFIFCGVFNSFNARTHRMNLLSHIGRNRPFTGIMLLVMLVQLALVYYGGMLFRTTALTPSSLALAISLAFLVVPADLLRKLSLKLSGRPNRF